MSARGLRSLLALIQKLRTWKFNSNIFEGPFPYAHTWPVPHVAAWVTGDGGGGGGGGSDPRGGV